MGIGTRIKKLIRNKGISAYNVSKETGISQSTLSRILNSDTKPNMNNLKILSKYFKVDEDWLLTGDGGYFIKGDNNIQASNNIKVDGDDCKKLLTESQKQISKLLEQLSGRDVQTNNLIEQQSRLIDKLK